MRGREAYGLRRNGAMLRELIVVCAIGFVAAPHLEAEESAADAGRGDVLANIERALSAPRWRENAPEAIEEALEFGEFCLPMAERLCNSEELDARVAAAELTCAGDEAGWSDVARNLLRSGPDEARRALIVNMNVRTQRRVVLELAPLLCNKELRPDILLSFRTEAFPPNLVIPLVDFGDARDVEATAVYLGWWPSRSGRDFLRACLSHGDAVGDRVRGNEMPPAGWGPWRICDLAAEVLLRWECDSESEIRKFRESGSGHRDQEVARLRGSLLPPASSPSISAYRSVLLDVARPFGERCVAAELILGAEPVEGEREALLGDLVGLPLDATILESLVGGAPPEARHFTPQIVQRLLDHAALEVRETCLRQLVDVGPDAGLVSLGEEYHRRVWTASGDKRMTSACAAAVLGIDHGALLVLSAAGGCDQQTARMGARTVQLLHRALRWEPGLGDAQKFLFRALNRTSRGCAEALLQLEYRAACACPYCADHVAVILSVLRSIEWE
jgi:hypothetical protein